MKEYIEREAVLEIVKQTSGDYVAAWSEIAHMPAADVAPVRHAYWIDHHSGGSFCSSCKRWVPYNHHPKYCETCGAKMDGKEDGHETN